METFTLQLTLTQALTNKELYTRSSNPNPIHLYSTTVLHPPVDALFLLFPNSLKLFQIVLSRQKEADSAAQLESLVRWEKKAGALMLGR